MSVARIGLIVPSSNTTMETEIPQILQRHSGGTAFTFHSSRMRMRQVNRAELAGMDADGERCAAELADARCDVIAYACLVALMCQGPGVHVAAEERLARAAAAAGSDTPVISSAGALIRALNRLGASRIALIAPYVSALTELVVGYIEDTGVAVHDAISLEVPDNLDVGRLDPGRLPDLARRLDTKGCDAIVLSACVQMPSLSAVGTVEEELGIPVLTAATATAAELLRGIGLAPVVSGAGSALSGVAAA